MERMKGVLDKIDISSGTHKAAALIFAGIGAYHLGKAAWWTLGGFVKYCLLPRKNLKQRYGG